MKDLTGGETFSPPYADNDWLNDEQPDSMQKVIPASLDEWAADLSSCIKDWEAKLVLFFINNIFSPNEQE